MSARPLVLIATCEAQAALGPEDQALVRALQARGVEARAAVWSDARVDWGEARLVWVRSCWDYHLRVEAFLAWARGVEAAGAKLRNSAALIAWNADKRYLLELERAGHAIIPTHHIERGAAADLAQIAASRGWGEVVIKPTVSASAYATRRGAQSAAMQAALEAILRQSGALVQPFMGEIVEQGEWSLLCFGGEFSHAVVKRPAAGDFRVQQEWGGVTERAEPSAAMIEAAERLVRAAPHRASYARVDGVRVGDQFLLMELELIEPFLFLEHGAPGAQARLVEEIMASL